MCIRDRLLLEKGAAVNAQSEKGFTALMKACWTGHLEAARLLLEQGADRTLKANSGHTAMTLADVDYDNKSEEAKAQLRALLA